jgi:hypothetical protein
MVETVNDRLDLDLTRLGVDHAILRKTDARRQRERRHDR